ncbi:hypothetical protein [Paenibacillus camerounensis]|uniref:hypothetical protein n=1 Tax=Paenibacillus camerounensis TaxID=1243663 RepID=UPI0005A9162A|nr:hypothetical protein [Paenibacillus camerounensis]
MLLKLIRCSGPRPQPLLLGQHRLVGISFRMALLHNRKRSSRQASTAFLRHSRTAWDLSD